MEGFFSLSKYMQQPPISSQPKCGSCKLLHGCASPKMPPSGIGRRKVLIVGEAPGVEEDEQCKQFVGKAGKRLRSVLKKIGIVPNSDCWFTNALICHPPRNIIKNEKMIDYCRPNLLNTISELKPEVILLLGGRAVASLILHLWKDDKRAKGGMRKWAGWQIPNQQLNTWLCPTYHPSFIERMENEELEKMWEKHIATAFQLKGRPWKKIPPFPNKVKTIYSEEESYHAILSFIGNKPVAFDYETNMLKPDSDEAMIACCSLSDGKCTIAFPWFTKAKEAMKYFLQSDTPKIASNMKFEERWTLKMFGHGVNNWKIDTMLAAHTLDNRPGITSIKFQAFVKLGVDAWGMNIAKFLEESIVEADMEELLIYCGLDSLYEYRVAFQQWKELQG